MDGRLLVVVVIVGGLHAPKFTDCYCTKQPQFATEIFSQRRMPISTVARTATAIDKCFERI
jgi:hypothetical protein